MARDSDLLAYALALAESGCSVIPVGRDKRPWTAWKVYQTRQADADRIRKWAADPRTTGFALICGAASGGVEALDFDEHGFLEAFLSAAPAFAANLPRQKTGNGHQIAYRRPHPPGNAKLAWVPRLADADGVVIPGGREIAIETRGAGGYIVTPHSLHPNGNLYREEIGSFTTLPTLTEEQAEQLHEAARGTCEAPLSLQDIARAQQDHGRRQQTGRRSAEGGSVIDTYNAQTSIQQSLESAGYRMHTRTRYTRPGADASPGGVHLMDDARGRACSYHHSSNDLLNDGHLHDPFDIFVTYQHGGDFKAAYEAAARELGMDAPRNAKGMRVAGKSSRAPTGPVEGSAAHQLLTAPADEDPKLTGIYEAHGGYAVDRPVKKNGEIIDWTPEQLTNWLWTPTLRLHYPDGTHGERGTLSVNTRARHEIQLEARAWNGRKDLLDAIGGYQAICFTTNNADISKISQRNVIENHDLPTAQGVRTYGLHEVSGEWLELYENETLTTHPLPPVFYAGTPIDPGSRSHRSPRPGTAEQVDAARLGILTLPSLVTPHTARALLGYSVAAAFAPRLTAHLGNRLPFLFGAGERESGKTSAAQLVLELSTGYTARLTKAGGMTPYQYDLAHSGANNLLSILDEYRPGEIDDAQLRKHHDLGTKWRGSGVGGKDFAYELNAPTIVTGEGFTDDAATRSRGVLYFTLKRDRGDLKTYGETSRLPLWAYAGHLHALARSTPENVHTDRLRAAEGLAATGAGGTASPRLIYALTFIAYGLLVLQDDVEPSAFANSVITATLAQGAKNTLEGGEEGMTNLELFLEQLSFVLTKVFDPRLYVTPSSVHGRLIIRPKVCIDLVQAHYKTRSAIANVTLLKQYAEQATYFDAGAIHKTPEGNVVRGQRLVLSAIPERCEADLLKEYDQKMRANETGREANHDGE